MRVKSTGLGKMELKCEARELTPEAGELVMRIESVEPVHWKITATMEAEELLALIKLAMKPKVVLWAIRTLVRRPGRSKPVATPEKAMGRESPQR